MVTNMLYQFIGKYKQFYKFNANCKESEKSGSGPGSCGGNKDRLKNPTDTFHELADEWERVAGNTSKYGQLANKFEDLINSNSLDPKYQKKAMRFSQVIKSNPSFKPLSSSKPDTKLPIKKEVSTTNSYIKDPDKVITLLNKSLPSITDAHKQALKNYTIEDSDDIDYDINTSYTSINTFADSGKDWKLAPESMKKAKEMLDQAIDQSVIPENIVVHRGIAGPILGQNKSKLSNIMKVGNEYTENRFVSTGIYKDKIKDFGSYSKIFLEIEVPKGSRGRLLGDQETDNPHESELLLPSGTKFKTTSITKDSDGNTIVHQRITGQQINGKFKKFGV